jgi:hypothetical protein
MTATPIEQLKREALAGMAGRAKLAAFRRAYDKRVSDIDFADWLAARGLTNIVRIAA